MPQNKKYFKSECKKYANKINEYKSYKGFYDLREFDMPIKTFKKLWRVQDTLFEMNQNKEYYRKWHPAQWQKAQLLSANYQQILFQYTYLELQRDITNGGLE